MDFFFDAQSSNFSHICLSVYGPDDGRNGLLEAMAKVPSPGSFAASRELHGQIPAGLWVDGVGDIAMPVAETQASQLIKRAQPIKHSYDQRWRLPGAQLCLRDPAWPGFVQNLCGMVAQDLGINRPMRAKIGEMHIYGKTPKRRRRPQPIEYASQDMPRDSGRLFLCLPSKHQGGDMLFRHLDNRRGFRDEFHSIKWSTSVTQQSFACCYSQVKTYTRRVKSGFRCVLIFDLHFDLPVPPPVDLLQPSAIQELREALGRWLTKSKETRGSTYCVYHILDHIYTQVKVKDLEEDENGLQVQRLGMRDFAQVQALHLLSREFPIEIFLAQIEVECRAYYTHTPAENSPLSSGDSDGRGLRAGPPACSDDDDDHSDEADEADDWIEKDDDWSDENDDYQRRIGRINEIEYGNLWAHQVLDLDGHTVLRRVPARNIYLQGDIGTSSRFTPHDKYIDSNGEGEGGWMNWAFRPNAVVIAPTDSLPEFISRIWRYTGTGPDWYKNPNLNSLVLYLFRARLHPYASEPSINVLWALCKRAWEIPNFNFPGTEPALNGDNTLNVLQFAAHHGAYAFFKEAAEQHGGELPQDFFVWIRHWLTTDENEARARFDAIRGGISAAVSAYRFFIDQFRAIANFVPISSDSPTPKYVLDWAREALCFCLDASVSTALGGEDAPAMVDSAFYFDNPSEFICQIVAPRIQERRGAIAFLLAFRDTMLQRIASGFLPIETAMHIHQAPSLIELMDFTQARSGAAVGADLRRYTRSQTQRLKRTSSISHESLFGFFSHVLHLGTGTDSPVALLVSKISQGASHIPVEEFRTTWLPFLHSLIPLLNIDKIPLDSTYCQVMFSAILSAYFKIYVGPEPIDHRSLVRKEVDCHSKTCLKDCLPLNAFLCDPQQRVASFQPTPDDFWLKIRLEDIHGEDGVSLDQHKSDSAPTTFTVTKVPKLSSREWESRLEQAREQVMQFDQRHLQVILGCRGYPSLFNLLHEGARYDGEELWVELRKLALE